MTTALTLTNISKIFGETRAVDNVSLKIEKGQFIGVIGRSGAGKSTMLRLINRLIDPTAGSVAFQGTEITTLKGKQLRTWRRDCAMIFQQFNLVPRLDVLTNVVLGRLNVQPTFKGALKLFTKEERVDALLALDELGMSQTALQRAETLSGGQQQRVAICRAMMQDPKMILADEPIASLDPLNARLVMESLRKIHEEKKMTVIANLHTLDTAKHYCDRIIGMSLGEVVFDDVPSKLTDQLAKEIYGAEADEAFEASLTSTSLGTTQKAEAS